MYCLWWPWWLFGPNVSSAKRKPSRLVQHQDWGLENNSLSTRILLSTWSCNVNGTAPRLHFQIPKELSPWRKGRYEEIGSIKGNDFSIFCKMITFYHSWAMETCFPNPEFVTHISCLAYLSLFLRKPKLTVGRVANLIRLARHVWMNKISYRTSIHVFPSDFLNKSEFLGLVWECSFEPRGFSCEVLFRGNSLFPGPIGLEHQLYQIGPPAACELGSSPLGQSWW